MYDLVSFGRYPYSQGRLTADDREKILQALAFLELVPLQHRFLDELSGGQRQRAFVAMVLCQDTQYVLLDEPLNNLDIKHSVAMMKQLRRAADELQNHRAGDPRHQFRLGLCRPYHCHEAGRGAFPRAAGSDHEQRHA